MLDKLLYLYIILIPVMNAPQLLPFTQKMQYSDAIFILLFGTWLTQCFRGKIKFQCPPLSHILIYLLTIFALTIIKSRAWRVGAVEYVGISYLFCLYLVLIQVIDSENKWWKITKLWVAISFVLSSTAVLAYFIRILGLEHTFLLVNFDGLGHTDPRLVCRVVSVFRHPGMFAAYLHASIVFSFILVHKFKESRKNCFWIYLTIILCMMASFLTKTRVNAGIALTAFLVLASTGVRGKIFSILKYALFVYAAILVVFVLSVSIWWIGPVKFNRDRETKTANIEFNLVPQFYFIQNKIALSMIKAHPVLGVGMGMYNYKASEHIGWEEVKESYQMVFPNKIVPRKEEESFKRKAGDPHSTFLGLAAETGMLGLAGIVFFLGGILVSLRRRLLATNSDKKYYYLCMIAGLSGFLLNGLYIDILTMRHFWFLLGMAAVLTNLHKE